MNEFSVILMWRRSSFFLPRAGVKVLGHWVETGDYHICERAFSDTRWYDQNDYDVMQPDWWATIPPPKENE